MAVAVTEVTCKTALTGKGGSYRLNPYVGCQHACVYCYATYIARWRGEEGPWGSWVQAKTNIPDCLLYTSPSPRDGLLSRMPSSA